MKVDFKERFKDNTTTIISSIKSEKFLSKAFFDIPNAFGTSVYNILFGSYCIIRTAEFSSCLLT